MIRLDRKNRTPSSFLDIRGNRQSAEHWPQGKSSSHKTLTPAEDQLLRQGFGRYAVPASRTTAAGTVRQDQHREGGMWFYCDCLPDEEYPPALVPVNKTHIRRHTEPPWPPHDDDCDFFKDPLEQHCATSSYRMPATGEHLNLIKGFGNDESQRSKMPLDRLSYARSRPALARLLARQVNDAGLQTIAPEWKQIGPAIQYEALRNATRNIELAPNVPLSIFIGISAKPDRLESLKQPINAAAEERFTGSRPHGVLVFVARGAVEGRILTKLHPPLPVRGKIAIFGEREGHRAARANQPCCRPPYLAICLIARPDKNSQAEVLKAYLHPCRSAAHLIMLDSDYERETLNDLIGMSSDIRI